MTPLTESTLEAALEKVLRTAEDSETRIALKPTKLIVPPSMMRMLMWCPALHKLRGVRGRKMAFKQRPKTKLQRLFRSRNA